LPAAPKPSPALDLKTSKKKPALDLKDNIPYDDFVGIPNVIFPYQMQNVRDGVSRDRNVAHACFRPITSSVSVVSDFVANGYQTMQHVSTSPPAIPDGQISRVRF